MTPVRKKLPFDIIRDLVPVSEAASVPNVLVVHPSVPANSVAELVGTTPDEFAGRVRSELDKWARVTREANIQPE